MIRIATVDMHKFDSKAYCQLVQVVHVDAESQGRSRKGDGNRPVGILHDISVAGRKRASGLARRILATTPHQTFVVCLSSTSQENGVTTALTLRRSTSWLDSAEE